jgi:hypothetical protein
MTLERLHLYILSLVIRLVGILFLYNAAVQAEAFLDNIVTYHLIVSAYVFSTLEIFLKLVLAFYFFLGAPPALRWVQRFPSVR